MPLTMHAVVARRSGGPDVLEAPLRGTTVVVQEVHADGARLSELAALVDFGLLTLGPVDVIPLADAPLAHAAIERGGPRGRIVLAPPPRHGREGGTHVHPQPVPAPAERRAAGARRRHGERA